MSNLNGDRSYFPADLFGLLLGAALLITGMVTPNHPWISFALIGSVQVTCGAFLLRSSRSYMLRWVIVLSGVAVFALGIYIALVPW